MNMLVIFITLTILNVVIQTVKSIATIKCGKWARLDQIEIVPMKES